MSSRAQDCVFFRNVLISLTQEICLYSINGLKIKWPNLFHYWVFHQNENKLLDLCVLMLIFMFVIEILDQELTDDNSCNQSHLTERNTESVPVTPPVYSPE